MIFVDTGAWLERDLAGRANRALAEQGWRRIDDGEARAFTSDLVLCELATYIKRAGAAKTAVDRTESVLASRRVEIVTIGPGDRSLALRLFRKFCDQPHVTWCDCVSFAIMKRLKIRRVFAFDGDFEVAGFEFWPDPSFSPRRRAKG